MARDEHSGFVRYPLENVALGLLVAGPKHGYGLYRDFEENFRQIWKAGQAKFYVALTSLQDDGCLDVTLEPQESRPTRKIYHLTPKGREIFMKWVHEPVRPMRAMRVEFIAKLRFFDLLDLPGAWDLIDSQIQIYRQLLERWQAEITEDTFHELVYDYRIRHMTAIIEWLEATREKV